jgi:putative FmdB family regulatory protein
MPMYEYRCQKCGEKFERLRSMRDADAETECPACKSKEVKRQLSTFASGSSSSSGAGCTPAGSGRFT